MTDTALATAAESVDLPATTEVLVALSPDQLPAAQSQLVAWCDRQMAGIEKELQELEEHRLLAASNGWKMTSIANNARRADQRLRYYSAIKAALDAGYLIVPNMPVDLLAIRVKRDGPTWRALKGLSTSWKVPRFDVPCELLPVGQGRYVDEGVPAVDASYLGSPDAKGERHQVTRYKPSHEYVEPDFPVRAVKPAVLEATTRAMALRIFDEIGMVRQDATARGRDPIMVGRVRLDGGNATKVATFFLAWWLNPADL
jgi:hypothetical protein